MTPDLERPSTCPVCNGSKLVLHRWHDVESLKGDWQRGFGYEPFSRMGITGTICQFKCLDCDFRFFHPPAKLAGDGEFYHELSSRFPWYYEKDKWEFDTAGEIVGSLNKVGDLLEVGCGFGHFLARMQGLCSVKGLEFNPQALDYCRQAGLNVTSEAMEDIPAESFDVVCAFEVLEHLPDPAEFIRQSNRLLRRNGSLILAVPDPLGYFSEADRVLLDMPPHHINGFTKKTFAMMAEKFGLEVQTILQEPLRFAHYRSYISNFIGAEPPPRKPAFYERVLYRLFGYRTMWDAELKKLGDKITEMQRATSYQHGKESLVGQTHLVVFRKL